MANKKEIISTVVEMYDAAKKIEIGDVLSLVPEPQNEYDKTAVRADFKDGTKAGYVAASEKTIFDKSNAFAATIFKMLTNPKVAEATFVVSDIEERDKFIACEGRVLLIPKKETKKEKEPPETETAIAAGSNVKAPMRLDFIRSLKKIDEKKWPKVYLTKIDGNDNEAFVFQTADESEKMKCIGLAPISSKLAVILKTGAVEATVNTLCKKDGTPCDKTITDSWGYIVEYSLESKSASDFDDIILTACRNGKGAVSELTEKVNYMTEQAIPVDIIKQVLENINSVTKYQDMVPVVPVKYAQADAYGELTRCLAYRIKGMNLRLIGNKGSGKNTLADTVDWILNIPQYRMQGNAEMDKLDMLGSPTVKQGDMEYQLSDMITYLRDGADVVLDEGNTIKPEVADLLHSLTDEAKQIEVPGYGLVAMSPLSAITITMNEGYMGTTRMNEATVDRFVPIQMAQPESITEMLKNVVPTASDKSLNICNTIYCGIKDKIGSVDGNGDLEADAMTIRGFIDALRIEPLLGLKRALKDNVANKPQDAYARIQLNELIESVVK